MIKVLLMEKYPMLCESLSLLINSRDNFSSVGCVSDPGEIYKKVRKLRPNILLINFESLAEEGVEAITIAKKACPKIKTMAIVSDKNGELLLESIKAGVDGYCLHNAGPDELFEAMEVVLNGNKFLHLKLAEKVLSQFSYFLNNGNGINKKEREYEFPLSVREVEILKLAAKGYTNKQIAQQLYLSPGTVKNHLSNIYSKLNCKNRAQAIKEGISQKLCRCLEKRSS